MTTPSKILICTVPAAGHVNPGLPIAKELIARGHDVHWYTGQAFRTAVEATGARFEPIVHASDPGTSNLTARFPARAHLEGLRAFVFDMKHLFLDEVPGQLADLRRILADFPADLLLVDTAFLAANVLHELGGPRWATYGITALPMASRDTAPFGTGLPPAHSAISRGRNRLISVFMQRVVFRGVERHHQAVRGKVGLAPTRMPLLKTPESPYLYLHSSTSSFEYPRSDLASQVHFIGPLLPELSDNFTPPSWWSLLEADRPVVLVTQGTVATDHDQLIDPTLRGLADENALVIAAGAPASALRIPVPSNAHVESFVPFGELLPHVSVMVTNGGYGGVQYALANGVPVVVAGTTEDKPEIAARVRWSGAGISLDTANPTPAQVRDAVRLVLDSPVYRRNAERIRDDYRSHNSPVEAADLLDQLLATGQPVHRSDVGKLDAASALPVS